MRHVVSAMLVIVAIIHLLPLSGVLGSERLAMLYGLSFTGPDMAILMRHRATLFGILGFFFIFAAFRPAYQTVALVGGFASVVSFLWLAWSVGGYNAHVANVVHADMVALACLVTGGAARVYTRRQSKLEPPYPVVPR